jgi:hypothetical protein
MHLLEATESHSGPYETEQPSGGRQCARAGPRLRRTAVLVGLPQNGVAAASAGRACGPRTSSRLGSPTP